MKKEEQKIEEAPKSVPPEGASPPEKSKEIVEPVAEKPIEEKKEGDSRRRPSWKKTPEEIRTNILAAWDPRTKLGKEVRDGKIKDIDEILDSGRKILEGEIVDTLLKVQTDLIAIGQSKGKFGGGKRRAWRQTQRKTKEGNVAKFSTLAVVGDANGHIGIGTGKAKETLPARDKAIRKAKLNIMRIKRDCAGFDCACSDPHTVPFEVFGKMGSVRVKLIPAPQGTGLVVPEELKKILKFAGIKDVYSRTTGKKRTTFNLIKAGVNALKETNKGVKK